MKNTYTVTGMTCEGCKASVEHKLSALSEVEKVFANLETSKVSIETNNQISTEKLQSVLSKKYTISEKGELESKPISKAQNESDLKQLFPLFLIFTFITIASILLNYSPWDVNSFMLDFMGLFYVVFSFFKLLDLKGFPQSFRMYDPLAKAIPVYAWIYPFLEVALGILFLKRLQITVALIITLVILGITTVGVAKILLNKKTIQCACLGTALKLPMTKATFIENIIMIVMAVFMLIKMYV